MAKANYDSEWVTNVFSDLQKALECPVCLDVVKKPFKLCARGHLGCISCLRTYPSCPTCKGEFLLENPVCIQNLLEYLPRSCRYNEDGCKEMVQERNDHEKFCGFRPINCRYYCKENILAKEFDEHLKTVHPTLFIMKKWIHRGVTWAGFQSKKNYSGLYISLLTNIFCISLDNNDDELLKITFESYPIGKMDGNYYAKVSFSNGNFGFMYTLRAFPVGNGKHDINGAEYCMKVPKSMLSNFINKDGSLVHEVFIFKD